LLIYIKPRLVLRLQSVGCSIAVVNCPHSISLYVGSQCRLQATIPSAVNVIFDL